MREEDGAAPARPTRDAAVPPGTAIVEVFGTDPDGDPLARPVAWEGEAPPLIHMRPEARGQSALAPGERVLARLERIGRDRYEGRTLRRLAGDGGAATRVLGVFERGRVRPVDRRARADWTVPPGEEGGASDGNLVLAAPLPGYGLGLRPARVLEVLGRTDDPRAVSLLCIHAHGIPTAFEDAAIREAEAAGAVGAEGREDLRDVPLVTIDGADARDFDDAVFAQAHGDGWAVVVAIADVAYYVRPGSALDRAAAARGNSVYFPNRAVPMLPEALSEGWCSLKPGEERGCLFVWMLFDAQGRGLGHRFGRGLMRSATRLTYEAVQAARDAGEARFDGLYGAWGALDADRARRGALDLALPERRVVLDADGRVTSVAPRTRLDSHRLIEAFMVAANACAAAELERRRLPCLYRVHDRPLDAKLDALRPFLATLGVSLPPGDLLRARDLAALLDVVRGRPEEQLVHGTVLRAQNQAAYAPDNIGHFGLALPRYAHFTSPIRRYADLLVHRALIGGLGPGPDGPDPDAARAMAAVGEHVTRTERRAAAAERDAVDRCLAAHMADRVGAHFAARISGVTRSGLFVTLDGNGAGGVVPLASLPEDRWDHDEAARRVVGRRTGLRFSLGEPVEVRLAEAVPLTGSLRFQILQGPGDGGPRGRRGVPVGRSRSR